MRNAVLFCTVFVACGDSVTPRTDIGVDQTVSFDSAVADQQVADSVAAFDSSSDISTDTTPVYPPPGGWSTSGPGVGARTFTAGELYQHCAYLQGGPGDIQHHNLVVMFDGYLLLPWAPEWGLTGGLSFYDLSDPCQPTAVGHGSSAKMRETHSVGFSTIGGRWAVVDGISSPIAGGIQFWDISNPSAPQAVKNFDLPGFFYPDAYKRVVLSVFWQGRYVFAGGSENGVYVVDALDPTQPQLVAQYGFNPIMQAAHVFAVGTVLVVVSAEGSRTVLLDISDPTNPQPIPGGDFQIKDGAGEVQEAYSGNVGNGFVYYARKSSGGGVIVYDITDPTQPTYAGDYHSTGNGGYVFVKDNYAFVGESSVARIYDLSNLASIQQVAELNLEGDLDTVTPMGNLVVLSVDDEAAPNQGSAIAPWRMQPDTAPPTVTWVMPIAGATQVARTASIGVTLNEMIEPLSAWEGSVRLYETASGAKVAGYISVQENVINFSPQTSLKANTEYTFEIPAGGIADYSGNKITTPFSITLTTGS